MQGFGHLQQRAVPNNEAPWGARLMMRCGVALALLLWHGSFGAVPAQAGFEGVSHFAGSPTPVLEGKFAEEVQLGGIGGIAVNYTGAGGVAPGTLYVAGSVSGELRVGMFSREDDGSLEFSGGWSVAVFEGGTVEHCGPSPKFAVACDTRPDTPPRAVDVDVDQVTGNVYVLDDGVFAPGRQMISVYTPDGSEVITRFGEESVGGGKTVSTPEQIHDSPFVGGIAVNDAGEVYVFDLDFDNYHRLMKFVPTTVGEFDEYEYAGTAEDIGAGFAGEGNKPSEPVLDAEGNVFVASEQSFIETYDPASPGDPPVCSFEFAKGGITAMTVNPETGESFFFSTKKPKRLYQLGPCNPATGEFEGGIVAEIEVAPERADLWGLTLDPARKFSPSRPAGILYGAAPGPVPDVGPGEPGQSSLGYIFAPAEENPPSVESESVSKVTATSAQLNAIINPKGFKTWFAFQYLTEAAYQQAGESFAGAAEAPAREAFLEGTGSPEAVSVVLAGLSPDTAYRYRVLAVSHCAPGEPEKACEDAGAATSLRTYPSGLPGPPDNRAYELVSPASKHGGQVLPADPRIGTCGAEIECKPGGLYERFPMQSSPDGEEVVYEGTPFGPGEGAAVENQYHAELTDSGWQSANLSPSLMQKEGGQGYKAFDSELDQAIIAQSRPTLSSQAPPEYDNLYSQPRANPLALAPLVTAEPNRVPTGGDSFDIRYVGASADLSRVFFAANDALTEASPFAPAAEDGGPSKLNLYEWERATQQLRLVNVFPTNIATKAGASFPAGSANPISASGRRAFWEANGQLYVREDAEETTEIPDTGGFLAAATANGSKVLLDNGHIYDLEENKTIDLTEGKGSFAGIVGQSDDLSHVYFIDTAVLTGEEENSEGAKAQAGKFNLYAWEGEGTTRYVATLLAEDNSETPLILVKVSSWSPIPSSRTAQASPNGRFLAFLSQAPLTGYDSTGPCDGNHAGGFIQVPCPEAFLYDSASGELSCASCNPSGADPLGWSVLRLIKGANSLPQSRYLTDSGRLYFDSQDSLSQFDTNEGFEDVYEFKAQGIGGCKRDGGCVALISAGREGTDSNFLAIDPAARSVFFTSRDQLVEADKDELIDLYNAREEGGVLPKPEPSPQKLPLQVPPLEPTPSSPTANDPGNAKPTKPCKKGQVKKKGKCVKKHKAKGKQRKKNQKRGAVK